MAMSPQAQVWLRGHLFNIHGYVEGSDRSVGIFSDYFILEHLTLAEQRTVPLVSLSDENWDSDWAACGNRLQKYAPDVEDLTEGEMLAIDAAFWATAEVHERLYHWSWQCAERGLYP